LVESFSTESALSPIRERKGRRRRKEETEEKKCERGGEKKRRGRGRRERESVKSNESVREK
jgi:hypothetical protein